MLLTLPALGQKAGKSGVGFKIGGQLATSRSAVYTYEPIAGATMGLYAPLMLMNRFEVQPELLLSMQGSAFTPVEGARTVSHLYYVQLPISAKMYMSNVVNLQCGLQAGWLALATQNGERVTDRYKPTDVGLNVGLGADMRGGTDLTLRYYSGLTPVLVNDDQVFPSNRTLQFTVGHRFLRIKGHARRRR
jgi:hypothetical protein